MSDSVRFRSSAFACRVLSCALFFYLCCKVFTLMSKVCMVLCTKARKSALRESPQVGPLVRNPPMAPNRQWRYTPAWAAVNNVASRCGAFLFFSFRCRSFSALARDAIRPASNRLIEIIFVSLPFSFAFPTFFYWHTF